MTPHSTYLTWALRLLLGADGFSDCPCVRVFGGFNEDRPGNDYTDSMCFCQKGHRSQVTF